MSAPLDTKIKAQTPDEVQRIAKISWEIRNAIRNALPAPPEQFLTVMVPGRVINLEASRRFNR